MKYIGLLFSFALFFSCSSNQETENNALCDCVEAGNFLNELSASYFGKEHTQASRDSIQEAKAKRDEICQEFQELNAIELQELAKDCDFLQLSEEK